MCVQKYETLKYYMTLKPELFVLRAKCVLLLADAKLKIKKCQEDSSTEE